MKSCPVSFPNGLLYCLAFQDLSDLQERSLPNRDWDIVIPRGGLKNSSPGWVWWHTSLPYPHSGGRDMRRSAWSSQRVLGQSGLCNETILQINEEKKKKKNYKDERTKGKRGLLCPARALHSASADALWHRILLPSFEQPGYSSNQIFLSPSCYPTLTLPIHVPSGLDSRHTILSFSLNSEARVLEFHRPWPVL